MKTYSRLAAGRRKLSEYEILSTDLHYHYPSGFELSDASPVIDWYQRYREGSKLNVQQWRRFSDPRRTTYRAYTVLQDQQEHVVSGLLDEVDASGYDHQLSEDWVAFLHEHYFPLRFPIHGLEMLAAYVGQMAPSSRLTNCASFQAGDELRRLQRIAYRTAQLCAHRPGYDTAAHRDSWERAASFQPLRELVERALVCYDWAEALVVLNVVIKPRVDRWINQELPNHVGAGNHDPLLRSIHFSFDSDSQWHRAWTTAALRVAIEEDPTNGDLIRTWLAAWQPLADTAVDSLATVAAGAPEPVDTTEIGSRIASAARQDVQGLFDDR